MTTTQTATTQSHQAPTCTMTGAELQCMREACAVSREELADLVGVQSRTVKHWESGRATVPADVAAIMTSIDTEAQAEAEFIMRHAVNRSTPYWLKIQRRPASTDPRSVYASRTPSAQRREAARLALIAGQVRGAMMLRMNRVPAIIEWATE
jgi:DNA-binding transcriptional regulator YiaG